MQIDVLFWYKYFTFVNKTESNLLQRQFNLLYYKYVQTNMFSWNKFFITDNGCIGLSLKTLVLTNSVSKKAQ